MSETKTILDPMCGGRMMWYDKTNPHALFLDKRSEQCNLCDGRLFTVAPDMVQDVTDVKFAKAHAGQFSLILFDPPHLKYAGNNSWLSKKYGTLPKDWKAFIGKAFDNCWIMLADKGVIVAKWSDEQIPLKDFLGAVNRDPVFGSDYHAPSTKWVVYMKIESNPSSEHKEKE